MRFSYNPSTVMLLLLLSLSLSLVLTILGVGYHIILVEKDLVVEEEDMEAEVLLIANCVVQMAIMLPFVLIFTLMQPTPLSP